MIAESVNQLITEVFVEQPLALPGSAKYREWVKTKLSKLKQVSRCNQDINLLNKGSKLLARKTG
jgi:hypothetical protein